MAESIDRARFNRLIHELLLGSVRRNSFERWEVELMMAFQESDYDRGTKRQLLRRYLKTANRGFEAGHAPPPPATYLAAHRRSR